MNWAEEYFPHIWLPYAQMKIAKIPLAVSHTKGCYIHLEDGRRLLDGIASWWSIAHGYNHPHILREMRNQLRKMPHVMFAGLANKPAYLLADRLVKFVNFANEKEKLTRVFYSDSGSIAVEVALKISLQYFLNQGVKGKDKILAFANAYHGDSFASMSLSDKKGMHVKFSSHLAENFSLEIPRNDEELESFESFLNQHHHEIAALIIEPLVQSAGGMKFHSVEILEKMILIARKFEIIIIFDECATGFYRTGKRFAFHHLSLTPDILILGKALTGGSIALAATISSERIFNQFLGDDFNSALMHGPTFMGNPLACTAANASLDLFLQEDFEKKLSEIEKNFTKELEIFIDHPLVKEIRILGGIAAIELNIYDWNFILRLRTELLKNDIWLRPFGNVIYFMPAFSITKSQIKKLVKACYSSLLKNDYKNEQ